jgi:hypothetical protein
LQLPKVAKKDQTGYWVVWLFQKLLTEDKAFAWLDGSSLPTFGYIPDEDDYKHFLKRLAEMLSGCFSEWMDQ